jgi:hypothetical protein
MQVHYYDYARGLSVAAHSDRFLFSGTERYGTIVLLSVAGPHSAVKAILAASASGYQIRADAFPDGTFTGGREGGGRLITAPLGPGTVHGLYVGPDLLNREGRSFALIGETPEKLYSELDRRFTLPAIRQWAEPIAEELKARGRLKPLGGFGASGWEVSLTDAKLDSIVTEGVKRGRLKF